MLLFTFNIFVFMFIMLGGNLTVLRVPAANICLVNKLKFKSSLRWYIFIHCNQLNNNKTLNLFTIYVPQMVYVAYCCVLN